MVGVSWPLRERAQVHPRLDLSGEGGSSLVGISQKIVYSVFTTTQICKRDQSNGEILTTQYFWLLHVQYSHIPIPSFGAAASQFFYFFIYFFWCNIYSFFKWMLKTLTLNPLFDLTLNWNMFTLLYRWRLKVLHHCSSLPTQLSWF